MHRSLGLDHEVLSEYARKLIRKKARRLAWRADFSRTDEDDIVQEITMHLLMQSEHLDPARAPTGAFVTLVIDTAIANLIRKARRQSTKPVDAEVESLDVMVTVSGEPPVALESLITIEDGQRRTRSFAPSDAEVFEDREAFGHAFNKLPKDLKRICNELMSVPPLEATRNLGITRHQMRLAMEMIREYFVGTGLA